jgi:hypothetical protein
MKEIREIISAIERRFKYRESDWEILKANLTTAQERLLELLLETDYDNVKLAHEVYRTDPGYELYRKDKLIIIDNLSNVLCRSQRSSTRSIIAEAHARSLQRLNCMFILRDMGYTSAATWYAEINIKQAMLYDFTSVICESARYLARVYSIRKYNPKEALKYTEIAKIYLAIQQEEYDVEILYNEIFRLNNQKAALGIRDLSDFNDQFNKSIGEKSYLYTICHGLVAIHRAELAGNHNKVIRLSRFYFQQFEKKKYDHQIAKAIFLRSKVGAHLELQQYVDAQQTLDLLFTKLRPESNNWFNAQDLQIRLSLATQDYTSAHKQLQGLLKNKRYKAQPEEKKDLYQLYAAYINFLVCTDHISEVKPWTKKKLTTYFRTTTVFDRDTRGVRIAMIIVELLYNILDHDYDAMERRIYSLKEYCSKYLKKDKENYRSNCFIKMLLEIPKALFHPEAAHRKAKRYNQRLVDNPLELAMQPREVEIIPYEQLWRIILHYLRQPRRRRPHAMDLSEFDL